MSACRFGAGIFAYFLAILVGPTVALSGDITLRAASALTEGREMFVTLLKDEQGASMAEYAMLLALIAVATISAVQALRNQIISVFNTSASTLGSAK